MTMRLFLLAAALIIASLPASAQPQPVVRCIATPGHLVAARDNADVGESYAIYHKAHDTEALPCRFDPEGADIVLEGYFALEALLGDYLVVSDGTSPVRTLLVYELNKGKALVVSEAEYESLLPTGVTYWERRELATPDNCPQYDEYASYGGSGVIVHQLTYSFATRQETASGQTRCDYLQ